MSHLLPSQAILFHAITYDLLQSSILSVTHFIYTSYSYIIVLLRFYGNMSYAARNFIYYAPLLILWYSDIEILYILLTEWEDCVRLTEEERMDSRFSWSTPSSCGMCNTRKHTH